MRDETPSQRAHRFARQRAANATRRATAAEEQASAAATEAAHKHATAVRDTIHDETPAHREHQLAQRGPPARAAPSSTAPQPAPTSTPGPAPAPRATPSAAGAPVTTPGQLRQYLDEFGSSLAAAGLAAPDAAANAYAAEQQTAEQDNRGPGPTLSLDQEGQRYRMSWLPSKDVSHASESLPTPSTPEEVADFCSSVLSTTPGDLDEWSEALREWLASTVLAPLLEAVEDAHNGVNALLAKYNDPARLPPLPQVIAGTVNVDADAVVSEYKRRTQAAINPAMAQHPQMQDLISLMHGLTRYESLLALLRGRRPAGLLSVCPPSYILERLHTLAQGRCLENFKVGSWWWDLRTYSADAPSDSALLLYVTAAFLENPGWSFHWQARENDGTRGIPLMVGSLSQRLPSVFSAILGYRLDKAPPRECCVLEALNLGTTSPMLCVLAEGRQVNLAGFKALFWALLMFLQYHRVKHSSALGNYKLSDDALGLEPRVLGDTGAVHRKKLFSHTTFGLW